MNELDLMAVIINNIRKEYKSSREFARAIGEDEGDIVRWRNARSAVTPRAVIKICRLHPGVEPHHLNPDVFPIGLTFNFGDSNV